MQDFPGAQVLFGSAGDPVSLKAAFAEPVDVVVSCLASRTGGKARPSCPDPPVPCAAAWVPACLPACTCSAEPAQHAAKPGDLSEHQPGALPQRIGRHTLARSADLPLQRRQACKPGAWHPDADHQTLPQKDSWAVDYQATLNVLEAAQAAGAAHFVLLSAICVQKPLLEFQHAKLALEGKLREARGITHSIVRPTAFFKSVAGQARP